MFFLFFYFERAAMSCLISVKITLKKQIVLR